MRLNNSLSLSLISCGRSGTSIKSSRILLLSRPKELSAPLTTIPVSVFSNICIPSGCTWLSTCGEWVVIINWQLGNVRIKAGIISRCHLGCKWSSISSIKTTPLPWSGSSKLGFAIANRQAKSPTNANKHFSPSESWFIIISRWFFVTVIRNGERRIRKLENPGNTE